MIHLITLDSSIEIGILENLLFENEINYLKQARGIGGYLEIATGGNIFGTDIFVKESDYAKAKEVLKILNVE